MVLAIVLLAAALVLVVLGGLLAATDAALGVMSRADLDEIADRSRYRRQLQAISDDVGAHVNALNFFRVLAETAAAVLVTVALVQLLDVWWVALLVAAGIMTAVSFVLVGSSPRSVGRAHADGLLVWTGGLVRGIRIVLGPLAGLLVALGDRVTPGRGGGSNVSSEEQLLSLVDEAAERSVLEADDRELIHSVFEFSDTLVREVMVPRTDMTTVDADATLAAVMEQFLETGVSRMPVIGRDSDDVVGVVYLRDVARLLYERPDSATKHVRNRARPAEFVPESKAADETLRLMQAKTNHLLLVVDEYGGVAGLVTMEDLIEELVGDISDEYDRTVVDRVEIRPGVWRISARMPIDDLGDLFGLELEDDDVDSAGGLLTKGLGHLPVRGETVVVDGVELTAERVEGKRRHLITMLVERSAADAADRTVDEDRTTSSTGHRTA
ncbi:hemolysin family protein [Curtobacterium sp. Leaf261]|uniref:hemolysin family protein n=1 Tax=Curtobacterium sp. Leaf261 TaxID=1736311 RepID=UPI0006F6FB80|nr:hemolysin family protein [Curtobacterium sp. Leaf261]KQO65036.1 hemolysin [Curtobacterium sp. Leaf261]